MLDPSLPCVCLAIEAGMPDANSPNGSLGMGRPCPMEVIQNFPLKCLPPPGPPPPPPAMETSAQKQTNTQTKNLSFFTGKN